MPSATATTTTVYTCPKCGEPGEKCPDRSYCLECRRAKHRDYSRGYRLENPAAVLENNTRWRRKNRERVNAYCRRYYCSDAERVRARSLAYYHRNKERIAARERLRRRYADADATAARSALFLAMGEPQAAALMRGEYLRERAGVEGYSLVQRGLSAQFRLARPGEVLPAGERVVLVCERVGDAWTERDPLKRMKI